MNKVHAKANGSILLEKLDRILRSLTFRRVLIYWFAEILLYVSAVVLMLVYLNETIIYLVGERFLIPPVLAWLVLLALLSLFFLLKRKEKSRSEQYLFISRLLEKLDSGISGTLVAAVQFAEKSQRGKKLTPLENVTVELAEQWLLDYDLKKKERKLKLSTRLSVPVYLGLPLFVILCLVIALDPVYRSLFRNTFYRPPILQTTVDISPSQIVPSNNTEKSLEVISNSTVPKDNESVVNKPTPQNNIDSLVALLTLLLEEYQRAATLQKRQTEELDMLSITNKDHNATKIETEYYTTSVYHGREIKRIFETQGTGIYALIELLAGFSKESLSLPDPGAAIFHFLLAEQGEEVLSISKNSCEEYFRESEDILEKQIRLKESNSELHRRLVEIQKRLAVRIEKDRIVFRALLHVARLRAAMIRIRQNENEIKTLMEKSFAQTAGLFFQELSTDERKTNETIVARMESQEKRWTDFESAIRQTDSEERDILLELLQRLYKFSNQVPVHLPVLATSLLPASFAATVAEMKGNLSKRAEYIKENQTGRAAALLTKQREIMDSLFAAKFRDIPGPLAVLVLGQYSEENERDHLANRLADNRKSDDSSLEQDDHQQDDHPSGENFATEKSDGINDLSNTTNSTTTGSTESDTATGNGSSSARSNVRPPLSESKGHLTGAAADQSTETPGSFAAIKSKSSDTSSTNSRESNSHERKDSTAFQPETWSKREEQMLPQRKARPLPGYEKAYDEYLKLLQ